MKKYSFLTIATLFIFNFLISNELSFTSSEINAGESATIDLSLDNPSDEVGGFQFLIVDWPNYGNITDIQTTERTSGFTVSFNKAF